MKVKEESEKVGLNLNIQKMNHELSDVHAGFRKGRGMRDQTANIHWIVKKARVPENLLLLLY